MRSRSTKLFANRSNSPRSGWSGSCPRLVDEGGRRGHDLAQQIGIGAIELEHRRQLLRGSSRAWPSAPLRWSAASPARPAARRAGAGAGPSSVIVPSRPAASGAISMRCSSVCTRSPKNRRRPPWSIAARACGSIRITKAASAALRSRSAEPGRHVRGEVDLAQLLLDRLGRQEVGLDEAAEIVGDALMVARDDGGVRNRQAERPAEQRHHGIPVGQPAHRRGGREGGDIAPRPMHRLEMPRHDEQHRRRQQQQGRRQLDAAERPARSASRPWRGEAVIHPVVYSAPIAHFPGRKS